MSLENADFIRIIKQELDRKKQNGEVWSLRSFAKSLQMDAGVVSRILAGKRPLSVVNALKLVSSLQMDPETSQRFIESVVESHIKRSVAAITADIQEASGEAHNTNGIYSTIITKLYREIANG